MRKATYKIPKVGADPEDAELSVTQVGGGAAGELSSRHLERVGVALLAYGRIEFGGPFAGYIGRYKRHGAKNR